MSNNIQYRSLDEWDIPENGQQYPLEFIEKNLVLKLKETESQVVIGMVDISDDMLLQKMERFHRKSIQTVSIEASELTSFLGKQISTESLPESSNNGVLDSPLTDKNQLDRLANDAPIINLVNSILIQGIRRKVSDIHIERYDELVRIRFRIDGELMTERNISPEQFMGVSSRLKIMANLNIMERRLPQDGRCSVSILGQRIDIRVSIVPIISGESIVMRLFNATDSLYSLEDMGFLPFQISKIRQISTLPYGLILVTGPTGSGKTTTLNAILRELRSESRKIITIEDPVEYHIEGIDQIQTNDRIGLTFESLLRRVLRQDPNVIMIGEIRDKATAELALRAALTGHVVFATLHTNDAPSAIIRLMNMELEPYLIAGVLRGVMAQRLVRKLCPECKKAREANLIEKNMFKTRAFQDTEIPIVYDAVGCRSCRNSGFNGRTAILEMFESDREIEAAILKSVSQDDLVTILLQKGMVQLERAGLELVREGLTTLAEIEKVVVLQT